MPSRNGASRSRVQAAAFPTAGGANGPMASDAASPRASQGPAAPPAVGRHEGLSRGGGLNQELSGSWRCGGPNESLQRTTASAGGEACPGGPAAELLDRNLLSNSSGVRNRNPVSP